MPPSSGEGRELVCVAVEVAMKVGAPLLQVLKRSC